MAFVVQIMDINVKNVLFTMRIEKEKSGEDCHMRWSDLKLQKTVNSTVVGLQILIALLVMDSVAQLMAANVIFVIILMDLCYQELMGTIIVVDT